MRYMNKAQTLSLKSPKAILAIVSVPRYFIFGLLCLLTVLFLIVWLFNISQLVAVLNAGANVLPWVLVDGFINNFRYGFHFIPIILVLISLFQAINLVLVKFTYDNSVRSTAPVRTTLLSGLAVAVCVIVAGSTISPQLTIFGLSSFISEASLLSSGFLVLALGIAMYSVYRMGEQASLVLSRKGNS